ncbi:hypothetical protein pb186bvf_011164 [Paramecium bursaria]
MYTHRSVFQIPRQINIKQIMDNKPPEERRINQFINKASPINVQDPELMKITQTKLSQYPIEDEISWYQKIMRLPPVRERMKQFYRFRKESLPMLTFLVFSTFMIFQMEEQYDRMKQSVHNIKTLKEIEVEKEQQFIDNVLKGRQQDFNVKIQEKRKEQRYKFEEDDPEEIGFDTRDDFLESIKREQMKSQKPQVRQQNLQKQI